MSGLQDQINHAHEALASALCIPLDQPFSKGSLMDFHQASVDRGLSGLLVVPIKESKNMVIAIAYGPKTRLRDAIDAANAALPKMHHGKLYNLLLKGATCDGTELICKFDGFESSWEFSFQPRRQSGSKDLRPTLRSARAPSDTANEHPGFRPRIQAQQSGSGGGWGGPPPRRSHGRAQSGSSGTNNTRSHTQAGRSNNPPPLKFVGIEGTPVKIPLSETAPRWRIVNPGLNFHGKCQNPSCPSVNDTVYVIKGMGTFQLHQIDSITNSDERRIIESCPECHSPAIMTGMGFMQCVWDAWGIVLSSDGHIDTFRKQERTVRPEDMFQSFLPSSKEHGGEAQYRTLTVRIRPLAKPSMCIACGIREAKPLANLSCAHGPVCEQCEKGIEEKKEQCPACKAAPTYTLLHAVKVEPPSGVASSPDNTLRRIADWIEIRTDEIMRSVQK